MNETNIFYSISPEIKDIQSPLTIASSISYYTLEQYTIKRLDIAVIRILISFSRPLNLDSTSGLALSIEISCSPKRLLAFLKKIFCPPQTLVFQQEFNSEHIYIVVDETTFSEYFFRQGQQKSLITKSCQTNTFQRNPFKTLNSKRYISLALIPTTDQQQ